MVLRRALLRRQRHARRSPQAVTTLEETERTAQRVLGQAHPIVVAMEQSLRGETHEPSTSVSDGARETRPGARTQALADASDPHPFLPKLTFTMVSFRGRRRRRTTLLGVYKIIRDCTCHNKVTIAEDHVIGNWNTLVEDDPVPGRREERPEQDERRHDDACTRRSAEKSRPSAATSASVAASAGGPASATPGAVRRAGRARPWRRSSSVVGAPRRPRPRRSAPSRRGPAAFRGRGRVERRGQDPQQAVAAARRERRPSAPEAGGAASAVVVATAPRRAAGLSARSRARRPARGPTSAAAAPAAADAEQGPRGGGGAEARGPAAGTSRARVVRRGRGCARHGPIVLMVWGAPSTRLASTAWSVTPSTRRRLDGVGRYAIDAAPSTRRRARGRRARHGRHDAGRRGPSPRGGSMMPLPSASMRSINMAPCPGAPGPATSASRADAARPRARSPSCPRRRPRPARAPLRRGGARPNPRRPQQLEVAGGQLDLAELVADLRVGCTTSVSRSLRRTTILFFSSASVTLVLVPRSRRPAVVSAAAADGASLRTSRRAVLRVLDASSGAARGNGRC